MFLPPAQGGAYVVQDVQILGAVHHYLTDPRSWTVVPAGIAMSDIAQRAQQLTFRTITPEPPRRVCTALISKAYKETALIRAFLKCCDSFVENHSYLQSIPRTDFT